MTLGIVIPTQPGRELLLLNCFKSVLQCDPSQIVIVSPRPENLKSLLPLDERIIFVEDSGTGAAAAINLGLNRLTSTYAAWIGDDDQLIKTGIASSVSLLQSDNAVMATYGDCRYKVENGGVALYKPGVSAAKTPGKVLNKIPQPGSIFRRLPTGEFPQLQEKLKFVFDEQLFIDLAKHGTLRYINEPVATYLWHENSLSAGQRRGAIQEAVELRWRNSGPLSRAVFLIPWCVMLLDSIVPTKAYSRHLGKKRWIRES